MVFIKYFLSQKGLVLNILLLLRLNNTNKMNCCFPVCCLQDSDILSLGVSSHHSWWKENGPGCESERLPSAGWQNQQNPELTIVRSCWLEYQYIEILLCIIQLLISLPGFVYACYVASTFSDEDDSFNFIGEFHHPSKPTKLLF